MQEIRDFAEQPNPCIAAGADLHMISGKFVSKTSVLSKGLSEILSACSSFIGLWLQALISVATFRTTNKTVAILVAAYALFETLHIPWSISSSQDIYQRSARAKREMNMKAYEISYRISSLGH